MRSFALGVVASLVSLPIAAIGCFALGLTQIRSDSKPSGWESQLMNSAVHAAVRRNASGITNPAPASDQILVSGGKLYVEGCAGCHGELAKPFREDHDHFPPVPQLPHVGTQYSEPEAYWIVKHGIRMSAMSAYGHFYSEQQLWALAAFVNRIQNLPPDVLRAIQAKKDQVRP
jgi:mono/diheme cytochrome c family protein